MEPADSVQDGCSDSAQWFFSFSVTVQLLGGQHKTTAQTRILHLNPAAPTGAASVRLLHKGRPVYHLPVAEVHHVGYDTTEPCLLRITSKAGSRMLVDFNSQQDNELFRSALAAATAGHFDTCVFNTSAVKEGILCSKHASWCGGFSTRHGVLFAHRLLILDSPTAAYPRHVLNLACIDLPPAPARWEDTPKCVRLIATNGKVFRLVFGSTREQAHDWWKALHKAAQTCPEAGVQQQQQQQQQSMHTQTHRVHVNTRPTPQGTQQLQLDSAPLPPQVPRPSQQQHSELLPTPALQSLLQQQQQQNNALLPLQPAQQQHAQQQYDNDVHPLQDQAQPWLGATAEAAECTPHRTACTLHSMAGVNTGCRQENKASSGQLGSAIGISVCAPGMLPPPPTPNNAQLASTQLQAVQYALRQAEQQLAALLQQGVGNAGLWLAGGQGPYTQQHAAKRMAPAAGAAAASDLRARLGHMETPTTSSKLQRQTSPAGITRGMQAQQQLWLQKGMYADDNARTQSCHDLPASKQCHDQPEQYHGTATNIATSNTCRSSNSFSFKAVRSTLSDGHCVTGQMRTASSCSGQETIAASCQVARACAPDAAVQQCSRSGRSQSEGLSKAAQCCAMPSQAFQDVLPQQSCKAAIKSPALLQGHGTQNSVDAGRSPSPAISPQHTPYLSDGQQQQQQQRTQSPSGLPQQQARTQQASRSQQQCPRACSPPSLGGAATASILQAAQHARESARLAVSDVLAAFPLPDKQDSAGPATRENARAQAFAGIRTSASTARAETPQYEGRNRAIHVQEPCWKPQEVLSQLSHEHTLVVSPSPCYTVLHHQQQTQQSMTPANQHGISAPLLVSQLPAKHQATCRAAAKRTQDRLDSCMVTCLQPHASKSRKQASNAQGVGPKARALRTMLHGINSGNLSTAGALKGMYDRRVDQSANEWPYIGGR